jgi:hypothetical protein
MAERTTLAPWISRLWVMHLATSDGAKRVAKPGKIPFQESAGTELF